MMAKLSDSEDTQCAGFDHDHYQEAACAYHEEHMMHDCVQLDHVVDAHEEYTHDSNIIMCDQHVRDNEVPVVHSGASSVPTDDFMMIYDDMCEPHDQSVSYPSQNTVVKNSLTAELAIYNEHDELYEQQAKFELTEREQKINEQLRIVISDQNFKEETLKRDLHSIKLQLASTIKHNKSMVEEVSFLKRDFKQKENKYPANFLNIKTLKEKVEDKLIKQDQSLQTIHMLCKPRPNSNELKRVKIAPHDYSKDNLLATFTPQKQLTQEQIFWSNDLMKIKSKALKERTKNLTKHVKQGLHHLRSLTKQTKACYLQEVIPFFKTLKDNFKGIQKALTKEVKEMKDVFEELEAEVAQHAVVRKQDAIELKNLLIVNDNLIAECLSQEVFCVATNSELNIAQFTDMHVANTTDETRCLALEAELANLRETNNQDNQTKLITHFSKLEVNHLNLQLKYQDLKDQIGNSPPTPDKDTLDFDSVFVIGKMQASLQGKDNTTDSKITKLTDQVTHLQAQKNLFRDENDKIKQHYKDLYDSIKITRAKHIEQELLEYAIGPCPHDSQPRAKQLAHIPLIRKKQVIVAQPSNMVDSVTHPHVVTVISQKINVPVPPSIGVDCYPIAHGSQPMSHVKPNRISPAKGKKRATLIVILSVRFTKLIIHHLQRKHMFHSRPDSPLHLSNEEPVLGYLKFSAKGTKREIFRMPIPGRLITANIRAAPYYQEYQENVDKHRGFLAGETRSTQDLPAPRPAKPARKPHSTAQKAPPRPSISSTITSTQPAPTSALEECLKDAYALPMGPLPPVVIREPESGKYQPLPEVPGKGKAKVSEEQVAHDLLSLQKHKKTSPADQYIFQRRVSKPTASSFHDMGSDTGAQAEGQAGSNPDETSEGQAGSNPDETSEGQAGPDPCNAEARVQSTSSPLVHAGSDREHMDTDVANVSLQPSTEQLYEGFTATIYPNVQENLKLAVEEPVLLEEPASSSGTLSSLQHLSRDFTFGDQFLCDKPLDADKSAKTEVELMVNVPIQQAMSSIFLMTSPIIDLTLDKHGERLYTLEQLDIPQQVDWAMQMPLRNHFKDLPEADMKEILHQRMWETHSYKSHEVHMQLLEALEKSINRDQSEELAHDLAEARKKKKKSRESPKTPPGSPSHQPPPPSPPAGPSGTSGAPRAFGSQVTLPPPPPPTSTNQDRPSTSSTAPSLVKMVATTEHQAWSTPDVMLKPLVSLTPKDLDLDEATEERPTTLEPAWSIRSSDVPVPPNNWASTLASSYSPPPEDSLLAQTGPAYEIVKVFHPDVIHLQYQMDECHKILTDSVDDPIQRHNVSKPLPLGGPPGQVTIQSDFFFNKDLEYLRYGSKGCRPALSISKMKATYYLDAELEQMVPDQFWIEEECKYDIAAMYGISHWWFQRQRFYIDRHTSKGDRSTVRTHMRILSVVRIEVFSMYGYDYMKKIVLRRADLNEHVIAERDFKYLYPSDFEDLNLLNLQGHLNHLPPNDKKILTTAVNQWTRQLVIRQRVKDFQLGIESYQTQSAPASDHSKSKRTIESRAKRSSKIISLGHDSTLLASSYTMKSKAYFKSPTHYPCVHSLRALSALRRSGLRMASTASKHYQGDSSKFYLITGRIPTVAAAGQKDVNSQLHAHSSNLSSMNSKKTYNTASATLMYAVMIQDRVGDPIDIDVEHISNVLEIASVFNAHESTLIQVFPLTLEGIAKRWPMLATAHTKIDVHGKKISLGVRNDQVVFNINKKEPPAFSSHICVINELDKMQELDDLVINDFENYLSSEYGSQDIISLSPSESAEDKKDFSMTLYDPDKRMSIGLEEFVDI
uniref:Uncharacterized protein n=1 Tax=Tanacetum cinerariifolium TaxID=118510 RepID=A0A6L2ML61_TANCI|nr:hypothetical protein [Tanacetum cinerariifolium]